MRPALVYHPAYSAPLPSSHRFPMAKFRLLHDHLRTLDLARPGQVHQPLPIPRRALELVHTRTYHERFSRDRLSTAEQRGTVSASSWRSMPPGCLTPTPACG